MRFSVGVDDFKKIRTDKDAFGQTCFYCDKSLLILDVINDGASVIVLPRPRRFGKTLNLSMLKCFFDITKPENVALFEGLKIADNDVVMKGWQGKYPVVLIGFKAFKCKDFETFKKDFKKIIADCYKNYEYLLSSDKLTEMDKEKIRPYFSPNFDESGFTFSLKYLTGALEKHYGQKVIVLMDEYDTPLQEAYLHGFFSDAIYPFRAMMGEVFKGNEHLYKGIITGITRITKESLFSGLNNLIVFDITSNRFAQYFGFTEDEVQAACDPAYLEDLKSWYNGYIFGDSLTIYNPWSVLNFLSNDYKLAPYWINTSGNELIRKNLTGDKLEDVRRLIEGKSIDVDLQPFTVLDNLKESKESFWNLLFLSGYLTLDENKKMRIPNQEIRYFFEKIALEWFSCGQESRLLHDFLNALVDGVEEKVQLYLSTMILESFSFHDVNILARESFYHGFLLGITLGLRGRYIVKSNRESGFGRYDIALYPNDPDADPGVVIEVKMNKETATDALVQVHDKEYATDLRQHGCSTVRLYGIHFDGKTVTTQMMTQTT